MGKDFSSSFESSGNGMDGLLGGRSKIESTEPTKKEEKQKVEKPVNIIIGTSIHTKLKVKCAQEGRRIRDVVEELIIKYYLDPE